MATWTDIPDSNLEPGAPARSVDAIALRDNPIAMSERATGAPVVQVPVIEVKTSGSSATWTWPDGVTAAMFRLVGAGGNGSAGGGATTITYNSITYTANGGSVGTWNGIAQVGGAGGTGGTCTLNLPGQAGGPTGKQGQIGGNSHYGFGGGTATYGGGGSGQTTGNGTGGGGGGETGFVRIVKVDGLNTVTYTVGTGASASSGATAGADGLIIIEY